MLQNYLIHIGNKNSGRYPRGSGENPHQHDGYGKVGRKMKRSEIKSVAKNMDSQWREYQRDEIAKYQKKKYGRQLNIDEFFSRSKSSFADEMLNTNYTASKRLAENLLSKYGEKNLDKIMRKSGGKFHDKYGVYVTKYMQSGMTRDAKKIMGKGKNYKKILEPGSKKYYINSLKPSAEVASSAAVKRLGNKS